MDAFANPADLSAYLQQAVAGPQAQLALNTASDTIRGYCGWSITQDSVTATLNGSGGPSIWLPTLVLTAVESVTEGVTSLVYDQDYWWTATGRLIRNGRWPSSPRSVAVAYTHGYAVVPGPVKQVCLTSAARTVANPQNLRSKTTGPFSWTAAGGASDMGPGLTENERAALARFQIPAVA